MEALLITITIAAIIGMFIAMDSILTIIFIGTSRKNILPKYYTIVITGIALMLPLAIFKVSKDTNTTSIIVLIIMIIGIIIFSLLLRKHKK